MDEDSYSLSPVDTILAFTHSIEAMRKANDPLCINDRDRWLVTAILTLLSDPHHHVGKTITRDLFKLWIERGGRVPKKGHLARSLRETDQFEFAAQYLYDYGMPITEIAIVLGVCRLTAYQMIRYLKEEDSDVSKLKLDDDSQA